MRIAYCTNVRLPSERAHGHQVAHVVRALHRLGHHVSVFAPYRRNVVTKSFHEYYGLSPEISMQYLGSFDPIASPLLPGVMGLWWMNLHLRRALRQALCASSWDVLYTRSPALLPALIGTSHPVVLELHQLPRFRRGAFVHLCNQTHRIVALTHAMAGTLVTWGVEQARIIVAGDAVDLDAFAQMPTTTEARRTLGVTTDRVVLGYVGRLRTLAMEKGVEMLLEAVRADRRFFALIVGGPVEDCLFYERRAAALGLGPDDVRFTGEVPRTQVPLAIAACDIATMPFPDLPHYRTNMSPLKMFEYMAACRPILTSDLPTIRDVLSEQHAWFFAPGSLAAFLDAARAIVASPDHARTRADAARELVRQYTWEQRMVPILAGVG